MYREAQRKRICPWHAEEQQHLSLHSQFQAHEGPSRLSRRYKAASVLFSMSLTMTQHHSAVAYMLAHPTCGGLLSFTLHIQSSGSVQFCCLSGGVHVLKVQKSLQVSGVQFLKPHPQTMPEFCSWVPTLPLPTNPT